MPQFWRIEWKWHDSGYLKSIESNVAWQCDVMCGILQVLSSTSQTETLLCLVSVTQNDFIYLILRVALHDITKSAGLRCDQQHPDQTQKVWDNTNNTPDSTDSTPRIQHLKSSRLWAKKNAKFYNVVMLYIVTTLLSWLSLGHTLLDISKIFQVANSSGEAAESAWVVPALAGVVVFLARFGVAVVDVLLLVLLLLLLVVVVVVMTLWIHGCQTSVHAGLSVGLLTPILCHLVSWPQKKNIRVKSILYAV